jgi:hypothetical protein
MRGKCVAGDLRDGEAAPASLAFERCSNVVRKRNGDAAHTCILPAHRSAVERLDLDLADREACGWQSDAGIIEAHSNRLLKRLGEFL